MKKLIITTFLLAMFATCSTIMAQNKQEEYLGLPGDNLNLYAVMKLFRESKTLEEFERSINDQNTNINNLDLNGDNFVDYIRVLDYVDGNDHTIVLQVAIDERENQDVAVFTVQKYANGQVQIQLIGDEALYGKNYIIEPIFDEANQGQTPNPGYAGNTQVIDGRNVIITRTTTYEIANWPMIRFIYLPAYRPWRSSWYWGYYPSYWHPWKPFYWHYYYGYHYNWYNDYYGHYRRWNHARYTHYNDFYYVGKRTHSPNVSVRIESGRYKSTYSHPDQRREGEAMYKKVSQSQNRRSESNSNSSNNRARRTNSQPVNNKQSVNTGNNSSRRSSTTVNNKAVTKTSTEQSNSTSRRPSGKVNSETVTRPSAEKNKGSARSSANTVSRKSEARPSPSQRNSSVKSSAKSVSPKASSSSRRSSGSSKAGNTSTKSQKSKESETKKAPRRK